MLRLNRSIVWAIAMFWVAATYGAEPQVVKVSAFVSILPESAFVTAVAGERVAVEVLVPVGADPHTYSPTPSQMASLGKAAVFFRIGMPFEERLMPRITSALPHLRVIDLRKGIVMRKMEEDADHVHAGHAPESHNHEGYDPHIWLDPIRGKELCETIRAALTGLDPAGATAYRANCGAVQARLDLLDRRLQETLAPLKGSKVYVFHPAFGYFMERYGLIQEAVEIGGKSPSPRQLGRLIEMARADGVKVIFVQPQFDARSAKAVAEAIGGAVVPLDPLAGDYFENLERMAESIRKALEKP